MWTMASLIPSQFSLVRRKSEPSCIDCTTNPCGRIKGHLIPKSSAGETMRIRAFPSKNQWKQWSRAPAIPYAAKKGWEESRCAALLASWSLACTFSQRTSYRAAAPTPNPPHVAKNHWFVVFEKRGIYTHLRTYNSPVVLSWTISLSLSTLSHEQSVSSVPRPDPTWCPGVCLKSKPDKPVLLAFTDSFSSENTWHQWSLFGYRPA